MNLLPDFLKSRLAHRAELLNILDNVGWLFIDKFVRLGLGLFVSIWLARYLGPEQFGLLSYVTSLVALTLIFADFGMRNIVVRDFVKEAENAGEIFGTSAVLLALMGLFAYGVIVILILSLRPGDTLALVLTLILGAAFLFRFAQVIQYWFESQVQSKYLVWSQNIAFFMIVPVKVGLILYAAPLVFFAWANLLELLATTVFVAVFFFFIRPHQFTINFSLTRAKQLIRSSWPLFLTGLAVNVYMKIDIVMIGQFLGDESAGIYSVAVRLSDVWYFMPIAITASLFPAIMKAQETDPELYKKRLQALCDVMVLLSLSLAIPLTFWGDELVAILFGEEYRAAGPVLKVHIWAAVFVFLGLASGKWLVAENLQMYSLQRALLGAIANVALNLILIPQYGPLGAAFATVASHFIATFLYAGMRKKTRPVFLIKLKALNPYGLGIRLKHSHRLF